MYVCGHWSDARNTLREGSYAKNTGHFETCFSLNFSVLYIMQRERERENTDVLMNRPSARVIVGGGGWGREKRRERERYSFLLSLALV